MSYEVVFLAILVRGRGIPNMNWAATTAVVLVGSWFFSLYRSIIVNRIGSTWRDGNLVPRRWSGGRKFSRGGTKHAFDCS